MRGIYGRESFWRMRHYFTVRIGVQSFEVDGTACRRSDTAVGNKDGETVVNPCGREVDKRKQAVDLKVTGEVSPSGRMAIVGRYVAECRIWVDGNTAKGEGMSSSWFCRSGQSNLRYFLVLFV